MPMLEEEGLGLMCWGPLAAGMLTGKVKPDNNAEPTRLVQRKQPTDSMHLHNRGFEISAIVAKAADDIGCSPAQVALAWLRTRPLTSIIIGVRTAEQLDANLAALQVNLPADVAAELDEQTALAAEYPGNFIGTTARWLSRAGARRAAAGVMGGGGNG